jgi:hypothetical protein
VSRSIAVGSSSGFSADCSAVPGQPQPLPSQLPGGVAAARGGAPDAFRRFVLLLTGLASACVAIFTVCPTMPPWLASQKGMIGPITRVIGPVGRSIGGVDVSSLWERGVRLANDLAPLPSLHEGMTILACVALWPRSGRATRVVLVTYPLVMAFSLVYTGEHYVSDLVAGALMVVAVIAVEERVRRRGIRLPLGGHALPGPAQSGPRAVTCARRPRRRPLPPGLSSPRAAVRCLRSSVRTTPRTTSRTSRSRSSQVQGSW